MIAFLPGSSFSCLHPSPLPSKFNRVEISRRRLERAENFGCRENL
jgi:hypothetical protein